MHLLLPQRALLLLAMLIVLGLAGGFAYAYLPHVVIEVSPALDNREVTAEVRLSSTVDDPDFIRFELPLKLLTRDIVEDQFFSREAGELREDYAKGEVTMINKQIDEQRLLPKTHLRHDESGVFFLTDEAVVIPPQSEITVGVTAKEIGSAGNVFEGRFSVDRLSAYLQQRVWAQSSQTFIGGIIIERPLTEAELTKAKQGVVETARSRALAELTVAAGGAFLREDLTLFEESEVVASAEVGSQANGFSVRATVQARSLVVDENDLLSLTVLTLREAAGPDEEFITYDPKSFSVTIKRVDFDRGEAIVESVMTGSFATKLGPTVFSGRNLAGLSEGEVVDALQSLPGVGGVVVSFSPFWVTSVPARVDGVEIVVKSQ